MSVPPSYRDGKVHVLSGQCTTCIFHPGNRMHLAPGRLKGIVGEALAEDSAIICHDTLSLPGGAVCRGFFDRYETTPLQLAKRMGVVAWDDLPMERA